MSCLQYGECKGGEQRWSTICILVAIVRLWLNMLLYNVRGWVLGIYRDFIIVFHLTFFFFLLTTIKHVFFLWYPHTEIWNAKDLILNKQSMNNTEEYMFIASDPLWFLTEMIMNGCILHVLMDMPYMCVCLCSRLCLCSWMSRSWPLGITSRHSHDTIR